MSVARAAADFQPNSGAGCRAFGRRDVLCKRLGSASGATVAIEIGGDIPRTGRWVAQDQRYVVELDTPGTVLPGLGQVRVDLPTGVHRFGAWLRPLSEATVEVFPHNLVDVQERRAAVRVPVDLPGKLGTSGGVWIAAVSVLDLSATGAGLSGPGNLSPGTRCVLRLDGAFGARLGELPGELVWCHSLPPHEGLRCGMRFTNGPDLSDHIYAWLSALRRTEGAGRPPRG